MALVAHDKTDVTAVKDFGMEAESFIRDDQNRINRSPPEGVHEAGQVSVDIRLAPAIDCQGIDSLPQPLPDFIKPVFDQTARRHDDGLLNQRFAIRALSKQKLLLQIS